MTIYYDMNKAILFIPCLGSSTYSTPGPAFQSQSTLQVDVFMLGALWRNAGNGGGGIPRIVSGGGTRSEHSVHEVLRYIHKSTPLAISL